MNQKTKTWKGKSDTCLSWFLTIFYKRHLCQSKLLSNYETLEPFVIITIITIIIIIIIIIIIVHSLRKWGLDTQLLFEKWAQNLSLKE